MKKSLILAGSIFLFLGPLVTTVHAKRLLPRFQTGQKSAAPRTQGVSTNVKFRADRRAINVDFQNLGIAKKVEYTLIYTSEGVEQGVTGTITPSTNGETRELLFGTCSKNVCRYHAGITGAKFTVTTTLKNGRKVIKPFKLKV